MLVALVLPLSEGLRCYQTDTTSQGVAWDTERMCPRYSLYMCAFLYEKAYSFLWARVCWQLLCLFPHFSIFERCLDSNPERCRSKHPLYHLSNPCSYSIITLKILLLPCCATFFKLLLYVWSHGCFFYCLLFFVFYPPLCSLNSNKGKHEVSSQNRKISGVNEKRCVLLPVKKVRLRKM
jgi:hypothetical protein